MTGGTQTIMEDDVKVGSAPLGPETMKTLSEISEYQIDRQKAELWAQRDIKFLVYDDTNVRQNGYDDDDEEGMLEWALAISVSEHGISRPKNSHSSDVKQIQAEPRFGKTSEKQETRSAGKAPHDGGDSDNEEDSQDKSGVYELPMSCNFCASVPEFPRSWKPRKFRLVRPQLIPTSRDPPGGPTVCNHYVAVSYCWPVPQKDENGNTVVTPGTYQVRELDGTVRCSRALDDVLDRAVEFAISCGLRMIWVDQECLPQPGEDSPQEEKEEQELGVQAMDVVYSRAMVTAGLLSAEITSEKQICAIAAVLDFTVDESGREIEWQQKLNKPMPSLGDDIAPLLPPLIDFLEKVSADRWYTRAWVAQEALSAGEALVLVLRLGAGIPYYYGLSFAGVEPTPVLTSMHFSPEDEDRSSIMTIPVEDFRRVVSVVKFFLITYNFASLKSTIAPSRARSVLTTAEALHPSPPLPKTVLDAVFIPGGINYQRPRQTVDAVGALTFLGTRGCRDVQDRVAIVANMCGFNNRLDTSVLARRCKSLRLALLALTLMNGDNSLLVPEAYNLDAEEELPGTRSSIGWLWPLSRTPHLLDHCKLHVWGFISQSTYQSEKIFTPNGPRLRAHLWSVEDIFDFRQIQAEWEEEWTRDKLMRLQITKLEGETTDQFQRHQRLFLDYCLKKNVLVPQTSLQVSLGERTLYSGPHCNSDFNIEFNEDDMLRHHDQAAQRLATEIIFAILRYLYLKADSEPLALGLANSIWHSLRTDVVPRTEYELPDEVGDWLLTDPDVLDNRPELLQLDRTRDGSVAQFWLIDRIMRDGFLWVGRYGNGPISERKGSSSTARGTAVSSSRRPTAAIAKSILQRQRARRFTASIAGICNFPRLNRSDMRYDRRNMAAFIEDISRVRDHEGDYEQMEEAHAQDLVSVFDVDGPCLIAIPHNGDWEMLPRPALRSMSVCWVVEPVARTKQGASEERTEWNRPEGGVSASQRLEKKTSKGEVETRGNDWRGQGNFSTMLAMGPAIRLEPAAGQSVSEEGEQKLTEQWSKDHEPSYRVLNKVRGLWYLMLDNNEYTFI
ncbi:hypothetical protein BDZ45DRAFT_754976 [Acephala macrosclerotiorum]|nr:hypothetical protein BDZ45DRAFT_754976 [Acephala macrosclerotiorum]